MAIRRDFVSDLIGGHRALTGIQMAERVARGLPTRALERVKAEMNLTDAEVANTLGISSKTISRMRQRRGALDPVTSDRLYRVARLFMLAEQVLGSRAAASRWLRKPQMGLGMHVPLDLVGTEPGTREVEDLLGRIEYGVLW